MFFNIFTYLHITFYDNTLKKKDNKVCRYYYVSVKIADCNQPEQLLYLLEYFSIEYIVTTYYAIIRFLMPVRNNIQNFSNLLNSIDLPLNTMSGNGITL
jgi:hypothetical protein